MIKLILTLILTLAPVATFAADTKSDRERKVKVALAMNAKPSAQLPTSTETFIAPVPREVTPTKKLTYFDGHAKAALDSLPLVIFVGCDLDYNTKNAILTKVDYFGDYSKPSVLIGYSAGNRLFVDKQLTGVITKEDVDKAVRDVSKKMLENPVQNMPAPASLNWQINVVPNEQVCNLNRR
jgi:hypothetical protein